MNRTANPVTNQVPKQTGDYPTQRIRNNLIGDDVNGRQMQGN